MRVGALRVAHANGNERQQDIQGRDASGGPGTE